METALDFCHRIYVENRAIAASFQELMTPIFAEEGLKPLEGCLLAELGHKDDRTINDLAHATSIRPTNLPPLCRSLEEKGLITRRQDSEDGRSHRLLLTPQGKNVLTALDKHMADRLSLQKTENWIQETGQTTIKNADQKTLISAALTGLEALHILLNDK